MEIGVPDGKGVMRIHIDRIPVGGLHLVETRSPEWLTNFPEFTHRDRESSVGPIQLDITLERLGSQVHVWGSINMSVSAQCSRCLDPVFANVSAPVEVYLVPERGGDFDEEDEGYETYSGDELDLAEHLRGQVALHYPVRFLCLPDCRGLCPACGANLNIESCSCAAKKFDSRWEKLKSLKF